MITAKAADIFRDDHIGSQSYFIIERKALSDGGNGCQSDMEREYIFWFSEYPSSRFFYYTKRESGDTDENVVICKDCSRILF